MSSEREVLHGKLVDFFQRVDPQRLARGIDAVEIIQQADRPVAHVIIEALVVKIDTSSVESLTVNFSDGAAGKFDLTTLIPSQTGGNIVASFSDLAASSAAITATRVFSRSSAYSMMKLVK